jgi:protein phosphatase PTC7
VRDTADDWIGLLATTSTMSPHLGARPILGPSSHFPRTFPRMATASMTLMRVAGGPGALASSLVRGCSASRVQSPSRWGGFGAASRDGKAQSISQRHVGCARHGHTQKRFAVVSGDETADAATSSSSVSDTTTTTTGTTTKSTAQATKPKAIDAKPSSVPLGIFSSGAVLVPHPDKAEKGGEDACFVLRNEGAFGVMDGVGGWADEGVDPAAYSNQFAEKSAAAVLMGALTPKRVIQEAHDRTKIIGSATACVAMLTTTTGTMSIGNLGDAGAMVVRNGLVEFNTPSQQHEFNCPFQLGCTEFYPESDGPEDVQVFHVQCEPGDILVMGSDGLWDNVPHMEVAQICAEAVAEGKDAQSLAEQIATRAFEHSVDEEYDSPFTIEARNAGHDVEWWEKAKGKVLVGGKSDDIAVVVAFLDEVGNCPPPESEDDDLDGEFVENENGKET